MARMVTVGLSRSKAARSDGSDPLGSRGIEVLVGPTPDHVSPASEKGKVKRGRNDSATSQ